MMITKQQVERMGLGFERIYNQLMLNHGGAEFDFVLSLKDGCVYMASLLYGHAEQEVSIKTPAQLYAFTMQLLGLDDEIAAGKLEAAGFVDVYGNKLPFSCHVIKNDKHEISVKKRETQLDSRIVPVGYDVAVYQLDPEYTDHTGKVGTPFATTMSALLNLCEAFGLGDLLYAEPVAGGVS